MLGIFLAVAAVALWRCGSSENGANDGGPTVVGANPIDAGNGDAGIFVPPDGGNTNDGGNVSDGGESDGGENDGGITVP